jgi:hypothetical protein
MIGKLLESHGEVTIVVSVARWISQSICEPETVPVNSSTDTQPCGCSNRLNVEPLTWDRIFDPQPLEFPVVAPQRAAEAGWS